MPTKFKTRAMMDMAAAFGHGARRTPTPLTWTPKAVEAAEKWLQTRLDKMTDKDYWTDPEVRSDALQRAFELGVVVATNATGGQITDTDIMKALNGFGIRKGPGPREYCPF